MRLAEGKEKLKKFCALLRALPSFWLNLLYTRDRKALFTCIVDQDWSDSKLPWLDMFLLCLDGVGLKQVSWAVRYLDKPQWKAVRSETTNPPQTTLPVLLLGAGMCV